MSNVYKASLENVVEGDVEEFDIYKNMSGYEYMSSTIEPGETNVIDYFSESHWTVFKHKVEDHFVFPMVPKDYQYMRFNVSKHCVCQEEYFNRKGKDCGTFVQPIEIEDMIVTDIRQCICRNEVCQC